MSLRVTILTLVVALLLATVGAIGGFGYSYTQSSLDDLSDRYLSAVSRGAAEGVDNLTSHALPLLQSIKPPAQLVPAFTEEERQFALSLVQMMRAEEDLTSDILIPGEVS